MEAIRHSAVDFEGSARLHLALNVTNLEQSIDFYRTVFDQEPIKIREGYAKFEPQHPSVNLTLNQREGDNKGGALSHLGVQLKDTGALRQQQTRLGDAGLINKVEDNTNCCFALQDKFWIHDPDGNELEFFVVLEADAPAVEPQEQAACC